MDFQERVKAVKEYLLNNKDKMGEKEIKNMTVKAFDLQFYIYDKIFHDEIKRTEDGKTEEEALNQYKLMEIIQDRHRLLKDWIRPNILQKIPYSILDYEIKKSKKQHDWILKTFGFTEESLFDKYSDEYAKQVKSHENCKCQEGTQCQLTN